MSRRLRWLMLGSAAAATVAGLGIYGWARYSLNSARRELESFRPVDAQQWLHRSKFVAGGRAEFHLLAGRAARMKDDFDAAEGELVACQRQEGTPSEESALEWAMLKAQRGEIEPVEVFLRTQVERRHPASALVLHALAAGYYRVYRTFDSVNCLRLWLEMQPRQPLALFLRGKGYQRLHAFGRAVDDLRTVLEIEPENDEARLLLANALVENSQAADAVPHLEALRARRPDDSDVLVRLALAWIVAGRTAEAGDLLNDLLAKSPRFGRALSARGQLELQLVRPAEAEKWLRSALREMPSDRLTHYALFLALQQQGNEREAQIQETRLKKIEAAISRMLEIQNRLQPTHPQDPRLNYELGVLQLELGYDESGIHWIHKSLQFDPQFSPAHRSLADYYVSHGDPERAAFHRARAGRQWFE